MKGPKKSPDEEADNKDVTNLALEAANIAATWDEGSGDVVVEIIAENKSTLAPAVFDEAALVEEMGEAGLDPVADFVAPEISDAAVEPMLASTVTEPAVVEEAFIREEDTLPKELSEVQAKSIIESTLFACVHPISFASLKSLFHGTNIDADKLRDIINHMQTDYAGGERGITLDEAAGGYQLRTKLDNAPWLRKMVKARPFRLSGPALEVLSIIAYKQPVIKSEIDQIRGVESGHLVRALMEKNLVKFAGKSELPGKPMLYGTTRPFLELFGLRNIRELPTLSEIDKLIPEGIGEISEIEGETLGALAEKIGLAPGKTYSESEAELLSITDQLSTINTTSDFFEEEKRRERERRDEERAQDLRERRIIGETLGEADQKWLSRFEAKIDAIAGTDRMAASVDVSVLVAETFQMAEAKIVEAGESEMASAELTEKDASDLEV